jgi:hypothetical protein
MDSRDPDSASDIIDFEPRHWFNPFEDLETDMKKIVDALNEPKILAAVLTALYAITIALALAIAGPKSAGAGERAYKPLESIDETIGSKHVSAVYVTHNDNCLMTVMIEDTDGNPAARPSAARIRVTLASGASVDVGADNGEAMQFTCNHAGTVAAGWNEATLAMASP